MSSQLQIKLFKQIKKNKKKLQYKKNYLFLK